MALFPPGVGNRALRTAPLTAPRNPLALLAGLFAEVQGPHASSISARKERRTNTRLYFKS